MQGVTSSNANAAPNKDEHQEQQRSRPLFSFQAEAGDKGTTAKAKDDQETWRTETEYRVDFMLKPRNNLPLPAGPRDLQEILNSKATLLDTLLLIAWKVLRQRSVCYLNL